MPHIPGHNRPFTSFLTQGMQNTNKNINNFNMPQNPNINNPMSQSFAGQSFGAGGGGLTQAKPWWERGMHESEGGGEYEPGGSTGPGGQWTPGMGNEPITAQKTPGWESPSDDPLTTPFTPEDYYYLFNQLPPYLQNQITEQGGMYSVDNPNSILGGLMGDFWTNNGWNEWAVENWVSDYVENYQDTPTLPSGETGEPIEGEVIEGYSFPVSQILSDFAGGGGLAGGLAKRLYYPGTSGGFAGVGSGIRGQRQGQNPMGGM